VKRLTLKERVCYAKLICALAREDRASIVSLLCCIWHHPLVFVKDDACARCQSCSSKTDWRFQVRWGHGEGKLKTKKMSEDKAWRMLQVRAC
jgi:hypothetical protein